MKLLKTDAQFLPMLREYRSLESKRSDEGVTPLEYQRWLDLRRRLAEGLADEEPPEGRDRRDSLRVPTRLRVEFKSAGRFNAACIRNLSQGGLFISTPFAAEIGTELHLRVTIASTGEEIEVPAIVVTNNVANDFSTASMGMGLRFKSLTVAQKAWIHRIQMQALEELGRGAV